MFFTKKIRENLTNEFITIQTDMGLMEDRLNELNKRINTLSDKLIEHDKKINALTEFLKSDRNDINALIQIVRKLQSNKGKK